MVPASPDHALAARGPLRPFTPHQEQEMCCCSFSPQTVSMREPEIVLLFFLSANGINARAGNCVVILSLRKRDKCGEPEIVLLFLSRLSHAQALHAR